MGVDLLEQKLQEAEWLPYARQLAVTDMCGYLTEEEIMEVWRRHPLWAPGGRYGPRLPSSPLRGIMMRLRRYLP